MNFEKIQESEFVDIYRINNGTLLYVKKYERVKNSFGPLYSDDFKKHTKIIRGCKGLRQLKKDYIHYDYKSRGNVIIPAGTFILNDCEVIPTEVENYDYEIKSNEGLSGNSQHMLEILETIKDLVISYNEKDS